MIQEVNIECTHTTNQSVISCQYLPSKVIDVAVFKMEVKHCGMTLNDDKSVHFSAHFLSVSYCSKEKQRCTHSF